MARRHGLDALGLDATGEQHALNLLDKGRDRPALPVLEVLLGLVAVRAGRSPLGAGLVLNVLSHI